MTVDAHVSTLRDALRTIPVIRNTNASLKKVYRRLLYRLSPTLLAKHRYRRCMGRSLPLDHPATFDEKLLWLMLYWRHPLKTQCADKYAMRSYVEALGYGPHLVPLLGVYDRSADIDFAALPGRFVLKCNHGSSFNIICRNKDELNVQAARQQLDRWIRENFAKMYGEVHYAGIVPCIVCEEFLDDGTGTLPTDYKLHCFHGEVRFVTVCSRRGLAGKAPFYDHYDPIWKSQLAFSRSGLHPERWTPPPDCYGQMIDIAQALSKPFPYVRMDFYAMRGSALLGEMTFTPAACIDTGYTEEAQALLGGFIHLPERMGA